LLARPSRHNAKSVGHRFSTGAALLGVAFVVGVLAGCGHTSPGGPINVPQLEREVTNIQYREKLEQGYTFQMSTRCDPSSGDLLHFVCAVTASGGSKPFTYNVAVTCVLPGTVRGPRCVTDGGDALD
jgi:hypothetical protein